MSQLKNSSLRYVIHDEDGPVRAFNSASEAKKYLAPRPEFKLVVLPKPVQPNVYDGELAVF